MRYFILCFLCVFFHTQTLRSLERENVPLASTKTSNTLFFLMQKDLSNGSLRSTFLSELKIFFEIETFVETGTNLGNTTATAAEIFHTVHTIELFPEFYEIACKRFQSTPNVHLHFGNSSDLLPSILLLCQGKTLFYLDGHWDGGKQSGKGSKNTPILEELLAIQQSGIHEALILIDDIADFQSSLDPSRIENTCFENYPDLSVLVEKILSINPKYQLCFLANALLAFPPDKDISISPLMRACSIDRLSTISNLFTHAELLDAEATIGAIQGPERIALKEYFQCYWDFERHFGWRSFAGLWMGLMLTHEKKWQEAKEIFQETSKASLPGWRIDCYSPR